MRRRGRDRHVPLDFDRRENRPCDRVTTFTSRRRQLSRRFTFHKSAACRSFPPLEENPLKGRTSEGGGGGGCRAFVLPFCLHIPLFFSLFFLPSLTSAPLLTLLPPHLFPSSPSENGNTDAIWLEMARCHAPHHHHQPPFPPPKPFPLNDGAVDDILLTRRHRTRRGSSSEPNRGGGGWVRKKLTALPLRLISAKHCHAWVQAPFT